MLPDKGGIRMFKERLKTTAFNIVQVVSGLIFILVFICGLVISPDWFKEVLKWGIVGVLGLILLVGFASWIYWQFIEPYQDWKRKKSFSSGGKE